MLREHDVSVPRPDAKPQKRILTQPPTDKPDDDDETMRLFMQAKRIAESNI